MKFFVEALIFAMFVGGLYYFWSIPHSSSVDMEYTKGYENGGQ